MNFTMSFSGLMPLAPVFIVALTAVVVMILTSIKRNHNLIATASVVGLNLAAIDILFMMFGGSFAPSNVMNMFVVDPFTLFYQFIAVVAALACCTLSHAYIETYKDNREELYILMLISVTGAMLMVASSHYASFFISLELLSIPVYGLLAYTHQRGKSLEAGVKYLVLSATASAILLMGMAYVYAYTGTLSFTDFPGLYGNQLAQVQQIASLADFIEQLKGFLAQPMILLGSGLIVIAIAFKLSLAPFHKWTPDVYQGAPAPITTYLATVAKVANDWFISTLYFKFRFHSCTVYRDCINSDRCAFDFSRELPCITPSQLKTNFRLFINRPFWLFIDCFD